MMEKELSKRDFWLKVANRDGCSVGIFEDGFPSEMPMYTKDFKDFESAREYCDGMQNSPTRTWKIFIWADTYIHEPAEIAHIF